MKEIFIKTTVEGREVEISNLGALRYMPLRGKQAGEFILKRPDDLPLYKSRSGYLHITFGRSYKVFLHRLVGENFVEKPDDPTQEYVLWFLDRNRRNVRFDNLVWVTKEEWYSRMSLDYAGRTLNNNGSKKLTKEQVQEIRQKISEGASVVLLAKEHGISHTQIKRIVRRENYVYI